MKRVKTLYRGGGGGGGLYASIAEIDHNMVNRI